MPTKSHNSNYLLEFLSVFMAVVFAFGLSNWNDDRHERHAEGEILREIANGLRKDLEDLEVNKNGHQVGLEACQFWQHLVSHEDEEVDLKELLISFGVLTRDFISVQNRSGYESLKSRGLHVVQDEALRLEIISLYEFEFHLLGQLEENYSEMQFHSTYFHPINDLVCSSFEFGPTGDVAGFTLPMALDPSSKNRLRIYLFKILAGRQGMIRLYTNAIERAEKVVSMIEAQVN